MKFLVSALLVLSCGLASAQSYNGWKLVEITDPDSNSKVGYIYHTYAVGKKVTGDKVEKAITGLRLVCTVVGKDDPVIAVFWEGVNPESSIRPNIQIDGKLLQGNEGNWSQDGNLVYRTITSSTNLMKALHLGKTITVAWTGSDGKRYITSFDLTKYKDELASFYSQCKMNI